MRSENNRRFGYCEAKMRSASVSMCYIALRFILPHVLLCSKGGVLLPYGQVDLWSIS